MDKFKKLIKILIILIIMAIVFLMIIIFKMRNAQKEEEKMIGPAMSYDENLNLLVTKQEYININTCLQTYISEINQKKSTYYGYNSDNKYAQIIEDNIINTNIYNLLSEDYIKKNSVTIDNVRSFVYTIEENCFYIPTNVYKKAEYNSVDIFAIEGLIETMDYKPLYESYLFLSIDKANNTFSIEQVSNKKELLDNQVTEVAEIKNNVNNVYIVKGATEEELAKNYILQYKRLVLGYPELVYNDYLDNEYKEKRFGNLEKFKTYIKENEKDIKRITYSKYQVNKQKEYTQYILIDQNNKYYLFNTSNIYSYKVLLDTYTVNIPQFIEKYQSANSIQRVGYNIQKCLDSINDKNYSYMYSKLSEEFKTNYYKTEDAFKKEIQKQLFDQNVVANVSSSNEGDIYVYKLVVSSKDNDNEKKNMTIIMQLKEENDFVMSFSFQ